MLSYAYIGITLLWMGLSWKYDKCEIRLSKVFVAHGNVPCIFYMKKKRLQIY